MLNRQLGNMLIVYGLLALFALGAGTMIVRKYNSSIEDAVKAKAELSELQSAHRETLEDNTHLRLENTRISGLLSAREAKRQGAEEERRVISGQVEEAIRKSPEVKDWSERAVPAALVDILRQQPPGKPKNGKAASPGEPAR